MLETKEAINGRGTTEKPETYHLETLLDENPPNQNSETYIATELTEDTTCGYKCVQGKWLQKFANRKAYIFLYGFLGFLYAGYLSYFNGNISTLEKRFKIPSKTMGLITTGSDISATLLCPVIAYVTGKGHRPRWVAAGFFLLVFATMIATSPHYIYGPGEEMLSLTKEFGGYEERSNSTDKLFEEHAQLCTDDPEECMSDSGEGSVAAVLLFIAHFTCGMGSIVYFTAGTAYIDDNAKKSKMPGLLSHSFLLRMSGPSFGYWLSAKCLTWFVSPSLTPIINEDDPRWIGAWWLGHIIIGTLMFMFACLMMLFPRALPDAEIQKKSNEVQEKENSASFTDWARTIKRLLRNPAYNCINLANLFYAFSGAAVGIFLAKYLETQFHQSASTANYVAGTVMLSFASTGVGLSGFVIKKYKPRARSLAAWNAGIGVVSFIALIFYAYIGCNENDQQFSQIYANQLSLHTNGCNSDCNCNYTQYSPVCTDLGETFISPCHAGCKNSILINGTKGYSDCQCVVETLNGTTTLGQAFPGACTVDCQYNFIIFVAILCFVNLMGGTGRISNLLLSVRCVEESDKSTALGFGVTVTSILGAIPANIFFGHLIDTTCLVWGQTCDGTGNCWLYHNEYLRRLLNFVSAGFCVMGILADLGTCFFVKKLKIYDDKDNEDETEFDHETEKKIKE